MREKGDYTERIVKWGKKVPADLFINWSSIGHKDEWITIVSDDNGWWPYWEYPHQKDDLRRCLDDAAWLLPLLLKQYGEKITITICQIQ